MIGLSAKVEGVKNLVKQIDQMVIDTRGQNVDVAVTYGNEKVDYAVYVHEDLTKYHPVGQAKFLEIPFRVYRADLMQIVMDTVRSGGTMEEGLRRAGEFLLEKSKELVPVATGALKDSGDVKVVKG